MSETSELPSTRTWDGAASAPASQRASRFESAWKAATSPAHRPKVEAFLPETPADRPGALLALLRAELALRYESGESPRVEEYVERRPDLDEDGRVALIYEDFCLREEAGEAPVPIEYEERFPHLVHRLRRVFDIHDLVGSGQSLGASASSNSRVDFPEAGQTIAGFHLRDELGRGSFARVFLAEERQLANRPVALKVATTGSREPQTLARLQHTHIVPVHSYRTDPATGLHMLCMPFFGRITLERLLAQPEMKTARLGSDVLVALDRLEPPKGHSLTTRTQFAALPFASAVAWWGARMAEALAHAHDRGVMHRDVKPSNVLVTSDGLPMLLDFNLAREPWEVEAAREDAGALGGTIAYMSPEQLDAIAERRDDRVDGRADLYSLGVLLFETLVGRRPYEPPKSGASIGATLRAAAEERRAGVPSIRETHPEIPAALESIIRRCLDPDPERRHRHASELAADLEAVVHREALPFTREPLSSRARRWAAGHRFGLALTVPLLVCGMLVVNFAGEARLEQRRTSTRVRLMIEEGEALEKKGALEAALAKYEDARNLAADQPFFEAQPPLAEGHRRAVNHRLDLEIAKRTADNVAAFLRDSDALRAGLHAARLGAVPNKLLRTFDDLLGRFEPVAVRAAWTAAPAFRAVAKADAERLEREYEELLLRRTLLEPSDRESVARRIEQGASISREPSLWRSLATRGLAATPQVDDPSSGVAILLAEASGRKLDAIEGLRTAIERRPGDFWRRRQISALLDQTGRTAEAVEQLDFALALRPNDGELWRERSALLQKMGRWEDAELSRKRSDALKLR